MKKISTILFLLLSGVVFSQKNVTTATVTESKITSLVYSVDSVNELKNINWGDVKKIFRNNVNKEEDVIIGFKIKNHEKDSNLEFKNVEVKGKLSDLDGTIEMAKKMIKIIENL